MKTQKEIQKEIEALKAIRPNVRLTSIFGDDNLAALDAQIKVLEEDLDYHEIYDKYDRINSSEYTLSSALHARDWIEDDEAYQEGLAGSWPLSLEE